MRIIKDRDYRERGPRGFMPAGVYYWATQGHGERTEFAWGRTPHQAVVSLRRTYAEHGKAPRQR